MKCQIFLPKLVIIIIILSFSNENLSQEKKFFKEMKPLEKTKAQIKLSEAYQFYSEGNFKNALLDYKDLIVINPSNAKAHFGIASCYYKLHNYKKAKYYIELAFENDPKADQDLYYMMGEIYFRLAELDKAKIYYEKFISESDSKQKIKGYSLDLKLNQVAYAQKKLLKPDNKVVISNMGKVLNTDGPEFAPSISNDGKYLMFTSRRSDTKGGNVDKNYDHQYFSDIYLSQWDSIKKEWSKPSNDLGKINTEFHDGSLSFKSDNSIIIYRNIYNVTRSGDIFEATYSNSGKWSSPKPIFHRNKKLSKKINSSYFESSASITEDESYIYFVSERPTGIGQTDIYYVKKTDHSYSEPIHLENNINTAGDEKCVFIHPNGKLLFFTSNGRKESVGSYDIYYCTGGHENWSEPINMGCPINTTLEEKTIYVSKDGNTAYVGGYYKEDSYGDSDLYKIDISNYNLTK